MERLDLDQIRQRLEASFQPYRCIVNTENYDNDIWLHILDQKNKSIIRTPWVAISKIEDKPLLSAFIEQTKEAIESKGYPIG